MWISSGPECRLDLNMDDDLHLNAEAIYAAMVFLRDHAESPEGKAAFDDLLEEKAEKVDFLRSMHKAPGVTVHLRPVIDVSDATKEEIYPGEPDSIDMGIELARSVLWGPPGYAATLLEGADLEDPMMAALSRFVADRAH